MRFAPPSASPGGGALPLLAFGQFTPEYFGSLEAGLAALGHPDQHDTDGNRAKTQQAPGLGRDIRDCLNKLFQPVGQKG